MFKSTSSYNRNRSERKESPSPVCVRSSPVEMIFPQIRIDPTLMFSIEGKHAIRLGVMDFTLMMLHGLSIIKCVLNRLFSYYFSLFIFSCIPHVNV